MIEQDGRGLHEPDENRRQRLADQDLHRRQRRHEQLIEGALLPFARDRQRGQQQRLQHAERGNQRRHAGSSAIRGSGCTTPGARSVIGGDAAQRPGCRRRRSRRSGRRRRRRWWSCGHPGSSAAARLRPAASRDSKSPGKLSTSSASPLSMTSAISGAERSVATRSNTPVPSDSREQPRRRGAATLIEHGIGRIGQVVGRAVAEQQRLQQGREERSARGWTDP